MLTAIALFFLIPFMIFTSRFFMILKKNIRLSGHKKTTKKIICGF